MYIIVFIIELISEYFVNAIYMLTCIFGGENKILFLKHFISQLFQGVITKRCNMTRNKTLYETVNLRMICYNICTLYV